MLSLSSAASVLLQAQPLELTLVASGQVGSQILAALIVGLLTAFGVQLLLTNLGIALGITTLRGVLQPRFATAQDSGTREVSGAAASSSRVSRLGVGTTAGLGVLLMMNTVLFVACFLATRFSQIQAPFSGAVTGLVIWSAYSLLLVWISSAAVTSLAGLVLGTTVRGLRQLLQVLISAVRGSEPEGTLEDATLDAIREEVQAALKALDVQALAASWQPSRPDRRALSIEHLHDLRHATPLGLTSDAHRLDESEPNVVRTDLVDYLLHLDAWEFSVPDFEAQVRAVLFDPDANPEQVQRQIQDLQPSDVISMLQRRSDLTAEQVQSLASRIEAVRLDVLATLEAAVVRDAQQELRQFLHDHCPTEESQTPERLLAGLDSWLQQADATRLSLCEPDALAGWLRRETSLTPEQIAEVCRQVQPLYQRHHSRIHAPSAYEQQIVAELQQSLVSYLRSTSGKRLTAKRIERKLKALLEPAQAQLSLVGATLPACERSAIAEVLRRRKSLDKKQRHAILDQIEHLWSQQQTLEAANSTQTVNRLTEVLLDYLNSPDRATLSPDQWKQKFQQVLVASGLSSTRLRQGVQRLDWQQVLSQLPEESQSQLRAALPMVQQWVRQVLGGPRCYSRRIVTRAEAQRRFALYLQYAPRAELASDRLRARLRHLRLQFKTAAENEQASEVLESTDLATLTQGLSQRSDLSPTEVEALATEIAAAWQELAAEPPTASGEPVLEPFITQLQRVLQPNAALDSDESLSLSAAIEPLVEPLVAQSQASLSQLNQALQAALEHAGSHGLVSLEQLQERLQQFNRETLLPLLPASFSSVQQDVLAQVERWRDQALQQVEQLQQDLQQRIDDVKLQTQQRLEETRKAAAAAAWWLFGILGSAAVTSALAGVLATQVFTN